VRTATATAVAAPSETRESLAVAADDIAAAAAATSRQWAGGGEVVINSYVQIYVLPTLGPVRARTIRHHQPTYLADYPVQALVCSTRCWFGGGELCVCEIGGMHGR